MTAGRRSPHRGVDTAKFDDGRRHTVPLSPPPPCSAAAAAAAAAIEGLTRFGGTGYARRQRSNCHASIFSSYSSSQRGWALAVLSSGSHQKCERRHSASIGAAERLADASDAAAWKYLGIERGRCSSLRRPEASP